MQEFTYYFWTFMIGSVMGVVIETVWCVLKNKKFESRKGLVFGPFNPLYGCATVSLSFAINVSLNKSMGRIFLIGVVIASVIEYLCSYYQEKVVGTVSWDYKSFKYNLNGRVNLVYSIMWGLLTLVWYYLFIPIMNSVENFMMRLPKITWACFGFMILDCLISLSATIRRKERRENKTARTRLEKHLDEVYTDELLEKIYPNSEFVDEEKKESS